MEEKISKNNVEVMMIDVKTKKVQRRTPEQVGAILNQIK